MKNKSPELILDFTHVTGDARAILSVYAQNRLFKMGYYWSADPTTRDTPQQQYDGGLYINSSEWNKRHITYAKEQYVEAGEFVNSEGNVVMREVYDAASQLGMFLEAAQEVRTKKVNIRGVDVTITADNITLDTVAFLTSITQEAQKLQKSMFEDS
jgi:hypothetical protein